MVWKDKDRLRLKKNDNEKVNVMMKCLNALLFLMSYVFSINSYADNPSNEDLLKELINDIPLFIEKLNDKSSDEKVKEFVKRVKEDIGSDTINIFNKISKGYRKLSRADYKDHINWDRKAEKWLEKSNQWLLRTAENGLYDSQYSLGSNYMTGSNGFKENCKSSIYWYKKAYESNPEDPYALMILARIYFKGDEDCMKKQDYKLALKYNKELYKHAAKTIAPEFHRLESSARIGVIYLNGGFGIEKNYQNAYKWFNDNNNDYTGTNQYYIGYMYSHGLFVQKDNIAAMKWYKKSASEGSHDGQYKTGLHYYYGLGITKDYVMSYVWLNISAANGSKNAAEVRDEVEEKLNTASIIKAQKISSRCLESKYVMCDY